MWVSFLLKNSRCPGECPSLVSILRYVVKKAREHQSRKHPGRTSSGVISMAEMIEV